MTTTCPTCGRPRPIPGRPTGNLSDELVRMVRAETRQIARLMDDGLHGEARERLKQLRATLSK